MRRRHRSAANKTAASRASEMTMHTEKSVVTVSRGAS
jgi:hypothetical protein